MSHTIQPIMAGETAAYWKLRCEKLSRRLELAEKLVAEVKSWHAKTFCPWCFNLDGTHKEMCLYKEWEEAKG